MGLWIWGSGGEVRVNSLQPATPRSRPRAAELRLRPKLVSSMVTAATRLPQDSRLGLMD